MGIFLEGLLISGIILWQLIHTVRLSAKIGQFKSIFRDKLSVIDAFVPKGAVGNIYDKSEIYKFFDIPEDIDDEIIEMDLVSVASQNEEIKSIEGAINIYLINNYGATVNFSLIKDIIDRETEVKDESISQSVTFPLYLGLAATMIGIIIGLFSMPDMAGEGFNDGINSLINGVKIAMIASVCGLGCTTWLSLKSYRKAKMIVQKEKNDQLSTLQATLLPKLIESEDTGISGLKDSLDNFSQQAKLISNNVIKAANQTSENIEAQQEIISKVESIDITRLTEFNADVFVRMEASLQSLAKITNFFNSMEAISQRLESFSSRTLDIENILGMIADNMDETRRMQKFLTDHFTHIENCGEAIKQVVNNADSKFMESVDNLNVSMTAQVEKVGALSSTYEAQITDVYKLMKQNLLEINDKYIEELKGSIPSFEKLDKLEHLEDIASIKDVLNNETKTKELMVQLQQIESKLSELKNYNRSNSRLTQYNNKSAKESTNNAEVLAENNKPGKVSILDVIDKLKN